MQIGMATFVNAKTYKCTINANKEGEASLLTKRKKKDLSAIVLNNNAFEHVLMFNMT